MNSIKICRRCKVEDGPHAVIHKHHINGNHDDNRPENLIFLCANCHMTLHFKRWQLSDIGLENTKISKTRRSHLEKTDKQIRKSERRRKSMLPKDEMGILKQKVFVLSNGIAYYKLNNEFINNRYKSIISKFFEILDCGNKSGHSILSMRNECAKITTEIPNEDFWLYIKMNKQYQNFCALYNDYPDLKEEIENASF